MDVPPFELERFFAEYEHEADIMLAESGIRSLPADRFDLDPGPLGYVIPTNGDPALRAEIGGRYGRNPEEVLLTVGTQEANFVLFQSLLSRGDHAVVVTPTYQALHSLPETIADVTRVDLEPPEWTLDMDEVAGAIRPETELIVINNPNNPTGRYHDPETIHALYDLAVDNDAYLHADEVYRLLDPDPDPPVASLGPHGISTAGLTKAYGLAGLRFGWLVADEAVIDAAWRWKDYTTISPSKIGQHVARQALGEQEADILAENRELATRNREIVRDFLDAQDLDWFDPVGVNGFVEVPPEFESSEAFCREFVEQESVVLAPGAAFGFDGYFRIGFGLPTDELREGLARLESFLGGR
ncbi:aspartate transaminase [Halodesulfurarchaeum formicicum]|uniref:Aspartate transaminase n=1 Tax=Halodesulfurarchaeum formicicum TaxID=1873524 RepID=A0A1D8S2M2_9EURY|nr:aminotransferase class I/II-fold pyridoxal phosphate-dependent enzyme [Halodesulfurarchaeum formicicum]AOW79614.1 aspartate transaminase [Halodesulfurarchaeum formicicum]APE94865.1 aspartate transaminase [Halodesulfurarchaeum formicicum]